MREILFRAKHLKKDEWVEGFFGYKFCSRIPCIYEYEVNNTPEDSYVLPRDVKPETIGQFTGLLDKNGVKIFEGDVLKLTWFDLNATPPGLQTSITHVCWKDNFICGFVAALNDCDASTMMVDFLYLDEKYEGFEREIIGNIFDNSELLYEKKGDR